MISRRTTLAAGTAAVGWSIIPGKVLGANNKVNIAAIGIGQRGGSILQGFAQLEGVNVVAVCDVDIESESPLSSKRNGKTIYGWRNREVSPAAIASEFPNAKKYRDFRTMFDEMANEIDAVIVGLPDHAHFPATMAAMMLGKPVYTEKPLARTFQECELLMKAEQKFGVATQMGNQGHSGANYHQFKLWKETGVIKNVTHVDAQMNNGRRWHPWGDVAGYPKGEKKPVGLDWDTWLVTTPKPIDFSGKLHYGNWRGWHQFGTGCFGDWGAHILDTVHEFLELGLPSSFSAKKLIGRNDYVFPLKSTINFQFPERNGMPAMDIDWYDGTGNLAPVPEGMSDRPLTKPGKIIYSDDLVFAGGSHSDPLQIVPLDKFKQMLIDGKVSKDYGRHSAHDQNFINAVRGDEKTRSPFSVSGPLCQMFALGCIAQRLGGEFQFDREKKQITNNKLGNSFLKDEVRKGWEQYYKL
ncbi:MAG: Gfo/Idh/MocA family oxidoreductase [Pontiella sp.]